MKKYLRLFLCLLLAVLIIFSTSACKEETENIDEEINDVHQQLEDIAEENKDAKVGNYVTPSEDDFYWEDVEGGVAVVDYYGAEPAIAIPDTLGGKNVVEITSGVFDEYDPKGVELPDTLVTIGEETFCYCVELVEVKVGNSVKEIGNSAFEGCVALSELELPNSLEILGDSVFANCTSIKQIEIPNSMKTIGRGAFVLSGITSITVPGSVESIGEKAFGTCGDLKTVVIQQGVQLLDTQVFQGSGALESVTVPDSVTEIGFDAFYQCGAVTVYVPSGSYAEQYVKENNVNYKIS